MRKVAPTRQSLRTTNHLVAGGLVALILSASAFASEHKQGISSPIDPRSWPTHAVTPSLNFGAWTYADFDYKGEYDLASNRDDNRLTIDPEAGLAFNYFPNETLQLYLGLEAIRFTFIDPPAGRASSPVRLKISKLELVLRDLFAGFSVQIGRQLFEDDREWFLDETMDGVRVHFRNNRLASEFSISQELLFDEDLLNRQEASHITNYYFATRYAPNDYLESTLYWLTRDATRAPNEDLHFLGMQAFGEWRENTTFWFNNAFVTGESSNGKIVGWGIDLGANHLLDPVSKATVNVGFAFGSGDDDPTDSVNHNFRQTGLHDNNATFNGVTSFRYYGELVRPSVSNIFIATLGGGFRPTPKSSVDIVYHYYRQHHAAASFSSALLVNPLGRDKDLGHEFDIIVGLSEVEHWKFELVLGVFSPGKAFSGEDDAYFGSFEFSYDY